MVQHLQVFNQANRKPNPVICLSFSGHTPSLIIHHSFKFFIIFTFQDFFHAMFLICKWKVMAFKMMIKLDIFQKEVSWGQGTKKKWVPEGYDYITNFSTRTKIIQQLWGCLHWLQSYAVSVWGVTELIQRGVNFEGWSSRSWRCPSVVWSSIWSTSS